MVIGENLYMNNFNLQDDIGLDWHSSITDSRKRAVQKFALILPISQLYCSCTVVDVT